MFDALEKLLTLSLTLMWLGIVGYIVWRYALGPGRKRWGSSRHRKRRPGKRCPKCNNVIYVKRTVCQHCGYLFPKVPKSEEKAETPERSSSGGHHSRKRGKYCPQCKTMIDRKRAQCQHCGYVFSETPGNPPPAANSASPAD